MGFRCRLVGCVCLFGAVAVNRSRRRFRCRVVVNICYAMWCTKVVFYCACMSDILLLLCYLLPCDSVFLLVVAVYRIVESFFFHIYFSSGFFRNFFLMYFFAVFITILHINSIVTVFHTLFRHFTSS